MSEPEIEAVREQLATWLQLQLAPSFSELEVLPEFPDGTMLAPFAIFIGATGTVEYDYHHPRVVSSVPQSGSAAGTVTYQYGYANGIQLSIDAWAFSKPARNQLQIAIRRALNKPPQVTLGGGNGWPQLAYKGNLSLNVDALFGATFTYRFAPVPTIDETSQSAQQKRWRSHFDGTADGPLFEQDMMAIITSLTLQGLIGPGTLGSTVGNQSFTKSRP